MLGQNRTQSGQRSPGSGRLLDGGRRPLGGSKPTEFLQGSKEASLGDGLVFPGQAGFLREVEEGQVGGLGAVPIGQDGVNPLGYLELVEGSADVLDDRVAGVWIGRKGSDFGKMDHERVPLPTHSADLRRGEVVNSDEDPPDRPISSLPSLPDDL